MLKSLHRGTKGGGVQTPDPLDTPPPGCALGSEITMRSNAIGLGLLYYTYAHEHVYAHVDVQVYISIGMQTQPPYLNQDCFLLLTSCIRPPEFPARASFL